ncbi:hypothetical protein GCM10020216_101420 [Nonomuraea helvata]
MTGPSISPPENAQPGPPIMDDVHQQGPPRTEEARVEVEPIPAGIEEFTCFEVNPLFPLRVARLAARDKADVGVHPGVLQILFKPLGLSELLELRR